MYAFPCIARTACENSRLFSKAFESNPEGLFGLQDHITRQICASDGLQIIFRATQDVEIGQHALQSITNRLRSRFKGRNGE